mmetsp:Transcript_14125/g.28910  ORF Transcript_14125/g.28910 Transcript_14125/m.28910 type:complete len:123 (-) Transcript_14125:1267-1635(-)
MESDEVDGYFAGDQKRHPRQCHPHLQMECLEVNEGRGHQSRSFPLQRKAGLLEPAFVRGQGFLGIGANQIGKVDMFFLPLRQPIGRDNLRETDGYKAFEVSGAGRTRQTVHPSRLHNRRIHR